MSDLETSDLRGIIQGLGPPNAGPSAVNPATTLATTLYRDRTPVTGGYWQCMPDAAGVNAWVPVTGPGGGAPPMTITRLGAAFGPALGATATLPTPTDVVVLDTTGAPTVVTVTLPPVATATLAYGTEVVVPFGDPLPLVKLVPAVGDTLDYGAVPSAPLPRGASLRLRADTANATWVRTAWVGQASLGRRVAEPMLLQNSSGAPATAGQVVYVSGNSAFDLADASVLATSIQFAVLLEAVAAGGFAYAAVSGVAPIPAAAQGGAAWTPGAQIYVSATTPGLLTTDPPAGLGQYVVYVGWVVALVGGTALLDKSDTMTLVAVP